MFRRVLSFIAIVGVAFLWACDNGGGDGNPTESLVGTWALESMDAVVTAAITSTDLSLSTKNTMTLLDADYDITFTSDQMTTSGSYSIRNTIEFDGEPFGDPIDIRLNNVAGSASYTASGNQITVTGTFFNYGVDGTDISESGAAAVINFAINGDVLTFSQEQSVEVETNGAIATTIISQTSTWRKQ